MNVWVLTDEDDHSVMGVYATADKAKADAALDCADDLDWGMYPAGNIFVNHVWGYRIREMPVIE